MTITLYVVHNFCLIGEETERDEETRSGSDTSEGNRAEIGVLEWPQPRRVVSSPYGRPDIDKY